MRSRPIYLHFIDRELRTITKSRLSDKVACDIVVTAALISNNIYIGITNLMESQQDFPDTVDLVYELNKNDEATIITSSYPFDEFIESRRRLYYDDKDRYPMYFQHDNKLLLPQNAYAIQDSTTTILEEHLFKELRSESLQTKLIDVNSIKKAILNRDESGITIGIVEKHTKLHPNDRKLLGQMISYGYTKRYMNVLDGCLIKNIQDISIVDYLSDGYYYYDIYYLLFCHLFFNHRDWHTPQPLVDRIISLRYKDGYWELIDYLNQFIESLFSTILNNRRSLDEHSASVYCKGLVKKYVIPKLNKLHELNIIESMHYLRDAVHIIEYKEQIHLVMESEIKIKKVLYIVATDTEYKRVFDFYNQKNGFPSPSFEIGKYSYRDIGVVGNSHIYLLKINMGAKGNGGAILGINDAELSLKPDFVIMVGIGFGLNEGVQKIGDIMVSTAIEDYGTLKLKEGKMIPRGNRISSDEVLLNRLSDAKLVWEKSNVHMGLIITNDILVNDADLVKVLKDNFPDAIGGEMEGCGLLANYKTPWILVKGICDFGHDKRNEYQVLAANNAIEFVDLTLMTHNL